ncbi:MAG TPA: DUF3106 domain-containing protein [Verrucomicrobiota bacterium]|nr:DUF3106 domain-containing protein [Verrucomicrobiota bacterium]
MSSLIPGWCVCALLTLALPLCAQTPTNSAPRLSESGRNRSHDPYRKSPVAFFRELLALTPAEQEAYLGGQSPDRRRRIEVKLDEYKALSPDDRELRLQATELHWYLMPLIRMPATNRAERLAQIPPDLRPLIEQRLEIWTIIPPPLSDQLLEFEGIIRFLAQPDADNEQHRARILAEIPPSRRRQLEAGIAKWQAIPEGERAQICRQFTTFFDLTPDEKDKALKTLSDAERRQMDKTLREFEKLPREQRDMCMVAFQKFADLSLEERAQFVKNAERWQQMTPTERQAWRDLVKQVPDWPPLPVGFFDQHQTGK